jgi:biopolymer transport protein ExbD
MRERRPNKMLIEPASAATGDIAFNLIVFFLVCASVAPDAGRSQTIPKADEKPPKDSQKKDDLVVQLTRQTVTINGDVIREKDFSKRIKSKLEGKAKPEDRIVVVKSSDDTPYSRWIEITTQIEDQGGIVTLQIEEEKEVTIPN